jgi:hypothetical protein
MAEVRIHLHQESEQATSSRIAPTRASQGVYLICRQRLQLTKLTHTQRTSAVLLTNQARSMVGMLQVVLCDEC